MKKILITIFLLLISTTSNAFIDINWTGNEVILINDIPMILSNYGLGLGLGGPINNQAVRYKAYEFTVEKDALIDYLFVSSYVVPNNYPEPTHNEYFVPQGINVNFQLYTGTRFFGTNGNPAPDSLSFTSSSYNFSSVDSHTSRTYSDFQIPFMANLTIGNNYWLLADARNEFGLSPSGATFNYTTDFSGITLVNPEPATMLLFGLGFFGSILIKKRK